MLIGHKKQWDFLKNKFESDQLSHAYLFSGAKGIGKKTFAIEFAKLINCSNKNACQKCANCLAIEKNNFPDFMLVSPEEGGEVKISKIKQVLSFLSYKSYYGAFKTVIVDNAEKMNAEAQNCFLKTLEEPKGKTLLILVASKPDMLLPTIASRCQTVKFFRPKDLPINFEKLEANKKILNDLLSVINLGLSEKFKYVKSLDFENGPEGTSFADIVEVMQKYLRRLLLIETGAEIKKDNLFDGVAMPQLNSKKYSVQKIKDVINLTEDINSKLIFTNASPWLALEILLMEF